LAVCENRKKRNAPALRESMRIAHALGFLLVLEHFQLKCLQFNPFVVLFHPFRILRGMDGAPKVLYTSELKTL
jgi:hypothetical protein